MSGVEATDNVVAEPDYSDAGNGDLQIDGETACEVRPLPHLEALRNSLKAMQREREYEAA